MQRNASGGEFVRRINAYLPLVATFAFKRHFAGHRGEQGIVLADAHVMSRMEMRTALTNQDAARVYFRAGLLFYTQSLGFAVASVARGADALLMREKLQIKRKHLFHLNSVRYL